MTHFKVVLICERSPENVTFSNVCLFYLIIAILLYAEIGHRDNENDLKMVFLKPILKKGTK